MIIYWVRHSDVQFYSPQFPTFYNTVYGAPLTMAAAPTNVAHWHHHNIGVSG
jgi:hypothetical protein